MPVSPCTFRSAQCAALIALAAAAGIQRVEAETASSASRSPADRPASVQRGLPRGEHGAVSWSVAHHECWFRDAFAFVVRFLAAPTREVRDDATASSAGTASLPHAFERCEAGVRLPRPSGIVSGELPPARPFHWCTVPYALAYAVGPPAGGSTLSPAAVGIAMPGVFAANGLSVAEAAPLDEASSLARLARLSPRRHPAGLPAATVSAGFLVGSAGLVLPAPATPGWPAFPS